MEREKKSRDVEGAVATLKAAMRNDPDYAWGWHCAVAVSMQNEGVSPAVADRGAVRFMRMAFEVDTSSRVERRMAGKNGG